MSWHARRLGDAVAWLSEDGWQCERQRIMVPNRTTVVAFLEGGGVGAWERVERLVVKVYRYKEAAAIQREFRSMRRLHRCLDETALASGWTLRVPKPFMYLADSDAIVVEQASGVDLRTLLRERNCRGVLEEGLRDDERLTRLVVVASEVLAAYHCSEAASGPKDETCIRLYEDFSPANLLFESRSGVERRCVWLLDAPDAGEFGAASYDVGTFTFELWRSGLHPRVLMKYDFPEARRLGRSFVKQYCANAGDADLDWTDVVSAELDRWQRVVSWYADWRAYEHPYRELARAAYMFPLLVVARVLLVR